MKSHTPALFLIAAGALFISCGSDTPQSSPPPAVDPPVHVQPAQGQGTIVGQVLFKGIPPVQKRIAVNKDKEACGEFKDSEELVVNSSSKGIRFAVVSFQRDKDIDNVPKLAVVAEATLDQKGCRFQPHVLLVPAPGKIKVLNPDGVLHNFHAFSQVNPAVNKAQPGFKKEMAVPFNKPEIIRIGCDTHSWMSGWIVMQEHPFYAVTDEKGNFKIEGVPAGKRVLKVWHEILGELAAAVEVKANQVSNVVLEMELKKAVGRELYEARCAMCHGISGKGDGSAAAALPNKPADLNSGKVQNKSDSELAKVVRDGTDKGMPPWKNILKNEEVEAVVKYLRELGNRK